MNLKQIKISCGQMEYRYEQILQWFKEYSETKKKQDDTKMRK